MSSSPKPKVFSAAKVTWLVSQGHAPNVTHGAGTWGASWDTWSQWSEKWIAQIAALLDKMPSVGQIVFENTAISLKILTI